MIELTVQVVSAIVLSSIVTSLVLYCIKKLFNIEERLSRIEAYVNDIREFIFNHVHDCGRADKTHQESAEGGKG